MVARLTELGEKLCTEAAWEIEALARVLPSLVPIEDRGAHFVVRAMAGRLLRLSMVLQSALEGDQGDEEADKLSRVFNFENGQG